VAFPLTAFAAENETPEPGEASHQLALRSGARSQLTLLLASAARVLEEDRMKYLVVTGGVVSGLGKGISISSMGVMLKACGLRVTAIKIDPYLNSDAGTMSPFEHGEVFVLNDGGEADLDLGNYERA